MTKNEALFFVEMWLSDKCNKADKTLYQFMVVAYEVLKQDQEEDNNA